MLSAAHSGHACMGQPCGGCCFTAAFSLPTSAIPPTLARRARPEVTQLPW